MVLISFNAKMIILQLNSLDKSSWMEVIEERYLGRICGFPLCANPVKVKNSQKYRIDLKNKKISWFSGFLFAQSMTFKTWSRIVNIHRQFIMRHLQVFHHIEFFSHFNLRCSRFAS